MGPYVVIWKIYTETEGDHRAAALEVATQYFQDRIAAGEPDTACTFIVTNMKGEAQEIDLAAR